MTEKQKLPQRIRLVILFLETNSLKRPNPTMNRWISTSLGVQKLFKQMNELFFHKHGYCCALSGDAINSY